MKTLLRFCLLVPFFLAWISLAQAAEAVKTPAPKAQEELDEVRAALEKRMPGMKPDEVRTTPLSGLYEVRFGAKLFYVSRDGRYLLNARIVDLQTSENLTVKRIFESRMRALEELGEKNMIVFGPEKGKAAHTITVYTDLDCPYCRKLHDEIQEYNRLGFKVRYLLYPRAGPGSDTYLKSVSVWCANQRKDAFTRAKKGENIKPGTCENPVDTHMRLGQQMEITGTPAIVMENGEIILSYVPAAELKRALEQAAAR